MARKRRGLVAKASDGLSQPRRRWRHISRSSMEFDATTKPAIKRLARRGGVKRMSGLVFEETRGSLHTYLKGVVRDTVLYTGHADRTTVSSEDVKRALRWSGRTLYG
ncbi:hypothetical protein B0H17DRAFT_1052243 [Mycena rosella]|uniref:Histone H4 n=1 Tax=Mycena rosella TaxID=1033263 RepID=A0AAD7DRI8_MYCRO|nr:hypothetical protein B0H17DRAFT_1052243 [Mycena rosella]